LVVGDEFGVIKPRRDDGDVIHPVAPRTADTIIESQKSSPRRRRRAKWCHRSRYSQTRALRVAAKAQVCEYADLWYRGEQDFNGSCYLRVAHQLCHIIRYAASTPRANRLASISGEVSS